MTQKDIILHLLKDEPTRKFKSYELLKASTKYGWLGASGDRRARELVEEGRVNHIERGDSGYAEYWHKDTVTESYTPHVPRIRLQPMNGVLFKS